MGWPQRGEGIRAGAAEYRSRRAPLSARERNEDHHAISRLHRYSAYRVLVRTVRGDGSAEEARGQAGRQIGLADGLFDG